MKIRLFMGLAALTASTLPAQNGSPGKVYFSELAQTGFNAFTDAPSTSLQQWMQQHFARMGVYTPYFDSRTSWYANADFYQDLYGVQPGSAVVNQHPDWILRDQYGNWLYIPFNCGGGTCPSLAGDITNAGFRAWWISQAQATLSRGNYKGLWVDDVNMEFRVSDGWGNQAAPMDSATGQPMTWDAWRAYVAQFVRQIRQAFPNYEILENSIWFAGPAGLRDGDWAIQQQIATANNLNLERGIASDSGLTGGTGDWSVYQFFNYVDRVHALGPGVTLEQYALDTNGMQYGLASYFMISNGNDRISDMNSTPNNWFSGYDVDLGSPLGARTYSNGVFRRDFSGGIVLLGEPGLWPQTVNLPGTYTTLGGQNVSSVTLSGWQGIILKATSSAPATPAAPIQSSGSGVTRYLSDINPVSTFNSWGVLQKDATVVGNPISLDGFRYQKGLGVHAFSELHYKMWGGCNWMSATVGVDDEIPAGMGWLEFQVWADGHQLYNSGPLVSGSPAPSFQVNVGGYQDLALVVTNGIYQAAAWQVPVDHADWANAIINCSQ
ncbi:MAG TPA: NPCBM/NEW2 domain-containing protein [Bryobacteraceae bacterium]|jgi:hypothetical protein|nr:NPCBM/NEW2 domain-containing protein [Bryobacteraceae bacterium]